MDEGVRLTTVSDEIEAETLCGFLRSAGIRCGHRPTEEQDSLVEGFGSGGPHEILVLESDLETARTLLAESRS